VSGGDDPKILLWDVATHRCTGTLQHYTYRVRSLAFDPSGQFLASGDDEGAIKLWNLQTAEPLKILMNERPYEKMNIAQITGVTEAQKENLRFLGAVEE
jgi:WD40 repeat protein